VPASRKRPSPGLVTSAMLLINYTDSIAKVFALLIEIATAATLPLYFGCTLALIVLRRRGQLRKRRSVHEEW